MGGCVRPVPYPVTVNWLLPKIERTTVIEDFLRTSLARMTVPGFRFRLENEPPAAREHRAGATTSRSKVEDACTVRSHTLKGSQNARKRVSRAGLAQGLTKGLTRSHLRSTSAAMLLTADSLLQPTSSSPLEQRIFHGVLVS